WGVAGYRAIDGSNDVSASALVGFACVALGFVAGRGATPTRRSSVGGFLLSAVLFGWAIAFKQFSLLVLPIVVRYLAISGERWSRYALVALRARAAVALPLF